MYLILNYQRQQQENKGDMINKNNGGVKTAVHMLT